MFKNKTKKNTSYLLFILISTFFYVPLSAVTASAGFTGGALGEYTNNAHQPNDATILTFNSLGITEAIISDDTDDGTFGGTQGNDYDVTLTFRYSNGTVKSFNASVNWRDTKGSTLYGIGLIPIGSVDDGSGYTLTDNSYSKTYILQTGSSTYSNAGGLIGSGNAATNGLLDALNSYANNVSASNTPSTLTSTVTATDSTINADGISTTTITVQLKDVNGNNISSGGETVVISTTAGTISSVTDNGDGTYTATLTSSNTEETATISATFNSNTINNTDSVLFSAVDSTSPTITGPSGSAGDATSVISVNENQTSVTTFTANETVTWSLTGGTDQTKFAIDTNTGVISFQAAPDYENPTDSDTDNDYVVEVTATDASSNTSIQTLTVTVLDVNEGAVDSTSPTITDTTSGSIDVDENQTAVTSFTANETVTWSLTGTDASLFSISSSGVLTFVSAPDYENPGDADTNNDYQLNIVATDAAANASTLAYQVNVQDLDDTAPVITLNGESVVVVELGTDFDDEGAVTDDGSDITTSGNVDTDTVGSYVITYTSIDASGNVGTNTRTVNVVDTIAPDIIIIGDNPINTELGGSYEDKGATATDASGDVTVNSSGNVDTNTIATYTITYTSTDPSGNTGTATRTVNVVDTTAPVITVIGDLSIDIEQGKVYQDEGATAEDLSGDVEVVTSGAVDTNVLGSYSITYTSTDPSGNTGTATRTVNVVDTTAPVITVIGDNPATVELGTTYEDEGATADGGETVTSVSDVDSNTVGSYTVTYSATDPSGNTGTATRTVNVVDTTAPVITSSDGSPLLENDQVVVSENQTNVINFSANESVTWSISGTDSQFFSINNSGELTFNSTPDYENPDDEDANNDYLISVMATDSNGNIGVLSLTIYVTNIEEVLIKLNEIESKLQKGLEQEVSKSLNNSLFYNEFLLRNIDNRRDCYEDDSKIKLTPTNNNLNLSYQDQHLGCNSKTRLYSDVSYSKLENDRSKKSITTKNASLILERDIFEKSIIGIGIKKSDSDSDLNGFNNSELVVSASEIILYAHKEFSEDLRGGLFASMGDVKYKFNFIDDDNFAVRGQTSTSRKTYGFILTGDVVVNERIFTTDFVYNYGKDDIKDTLLKASYLGETKNNLSLYINDISSKRFSLPVTTNFIIDSAKNSDLITFKADLSFGALCEESFITKNELECGYQYNIDFEKFFNQNYKDTLYLNYAYETIDDWSRETISIGMINKFGKYSNVEITPNISFHNELSSIEFSSFNLGFYFPLNYQ
jgi:hypothetical protein